MPQLHRRLTRPASLLTSLGQESIERRLDTNELFADILAVRLG